MRKLKLYIATSLDNKIARPDGAIDWLPDPNAGEALPWKLVLLSSFAGTGVTMKKNICRLGKI